MRRVKCFSCGGYYPDIEGPVHRYMTSSPGCWAVYGEILAREYSDPGYFSVHRLTVDAYAVQHPGSDDRQSIHSVGLHLVRLCLFIEYGLRAENANAAMLEAGKNKERFFRLRPPGSLGDITVAYVEDAINSEDHCNRVRAWARSAWEAWSPHHETVRSWVPKKYR